VSAIRGRRGVREVAEVAGRKVAVEQKLRR
jgi:hypothetical protein